MAGIKITSLPAVASGLLTDVFPVVQGGITSQETLQQVLTLFSISSGLVIWNNITSTSEMMAAGNGYIANNAGLVTLTLPLTSEIGTIIRVSGFGAGGWTIAQNALQSINDGISTTTVGVGGSLSSTQRYNAVELLCVGADKTWNVISEKGNLTIV